MRKIKFILFLLSVFTTTFFSVQVVYMLYGILIKNYSYNKWDLIFYLLILVLNIFNTLGLREKNKNIVIYFKVLQTNGVCYVKSEIKTETDIDRELLINFCKAKISIERDVELNQIIEITKEEYKREAD